MSGRWLPPAAKAHACSRPIMWPWVVRIGDRWKCTELLDNGERCGKVWRVDWDGDGRIWVEDRPSPESGEELAILRAVTDEELEYWVVDMLANQASVDPERVKKGVELFPYRQVVEAVRKYYVIGSRQ